MGRLTINEVENLKKAGILDEASVDEMKERGLVGSRKRRKVTPYMVNKDDTKVYPQLYFKGHGGGTDSNEMVTFRKEFEELIEKHTIVKKGVT